MKFAYISLQEESYSYDRTILGARVVQVQDTKDGLIDVLPNFFWFECADDVTADNSYYDVSDQQIKLKPVRPSSDQPNSSGTQTL